MRGGSPEFSRRQDLDGGDQGAHHGHGRQVGPQPPRGGVYRPDGHAPGPGGEPGGDDVQRDGEDDHAGTCSAARGNSRTRRSSGQAPQSPPLMPAPISRPRTVPSCLQKNGVAVSAHWSRSCRSQASSHGRAPGPDSPPATSQEIDGRPVRSSRSSASPRRSPPRSPPAAPPSPGASTSPAPAP